MKRRNFINTALAGVAGVGLGSCVSYRSANPENPSILRDATFSVDDNKITYYLKDISEPLKIIQISDTHLWMDDHRGEPFTKYSARMARAYNRTRHFRSGEPTTPVEGFEEVLKHAVEQEVDLFAMTGDIFSFPSEAAVEWVIGKMKESGLNYLYTTGNHDWHYEGMEGRIYDLRETWINERLSGLYHGKDPLKAAYNVKDITILSIDTSTYEIMPDQLEFFSEHVESRKPLILMMHIPMYAPGRTRGYGVGNPDWGAETDRNYELEGRERWPVEGHTKVTMEFHKQVFTAPNLLGIFAGHTHRQTVDLVKGIPQFVAAPNATGAYLEIDILPFEQKDSEVLQVL
jgi:predicted MPP superfamily phosphohydrolase